MAASRPAAGGRGAASRRGAGADSPLEAVGAVPGRAPVGHGPRGLLGRTGRPGTTSRTTRRARGRTAWGEDGLLGISDNHQRLCFALALWNGRDPILKERLFGLTGHEGNHGEDVKEYYFYLDATPTHSYMRALYKYPQAEYPVRAPRRGERAARAREARVRAPRHRGLRRRPLLRRAASSTRRRPERHPDPHDRRQPRAGGGAAPRAADALAPEHLGLGARTRGSRVWPGTKPRPALRWSCRAPGALARLPPLRRGGAAAPLHRERDQCSAPVRRRPARRRAEGRLPRGVVHDREDLLLPGEEGTKVAAHHQLTIPAGRRGRSCGSGSPTGCRRRPSDRSSTGPSPRASARPTSSTPP